MNASAALVVVAFLIFTATGAAVGANLTVNARGGGVVVEQCVPTIVEVEPEPEPEPTPEPTPSPSPEPSPEETSSLSPEMQESPTPTVEESPNDMEPEQLPESN